MQVYTGSLVETRGAEASRTQRRELMNAWLQEYGEKERWVKGMETQVGHENVQHP